MQLDKLDKPNKHYSTNVKLDSGYSIKFLSDFPIDDVVDSIM
jgi:hypothetical protein